MASMSSAQIVSVSAMQNPRAPAAHPPPGAVAEYGSQVTPRPLAPPTRRQETYVPRLVVILTVCVCAPVCFCGADLALQLISAQTRFFLQC